MSRNELRADVLIIAYARAGRDQLTDDDVFFQTDQRIDLALDRSFGQHACRLLEGCSREEGIGRERRFRDTEQYTLRRCRPAALFHRLFVLVLEREDIHQFAGEHFRVAAIFDADFSHHLADDDLDVFIVDINALGAVNRLHFAQDVILNTLNALNAQNILRIHGTAVELRAGFHFVARFDAEFRVERQNVFFLFFARDLVADNDVFLVILLVYIGYAGYFAKRCDALRLSCFEQFFDTRKTLRDIAGRRNTARVEGTHRQLCTGFADGLRRDRSDRFADLDGASRRHVLAVALCAHAVARIAGKYAADIDAFDPLLDDGLCHVFGDHFVYRHQDLARCRV